MKTLSLVYDVLLVINILPFVRVFGDGVNTGQFTKFTSLKCDEVPVCATSSPSISLAVQSPIQCTVEGQSKRHLPQSYVGVNYRQQDKVCEMFSTNPTSFAYNVQECQYMQKEIINDHGVQCSDINLCLTGHSECHPMAECRSWQGFITCTCLAGYSGDGHTCTDINECLTNNGGCSSNAQCTNTIGSFTCTCRNTYFGNGFTCTSVAVNMVVATVSGTRNVSCSAGYQLLSCGIDNSQTTNFEKYRYALPITSTACQCYDYFGIKCVVWCTNAVSGFEIITSPASTGNFSVSCSAGKKVLGCAIQVTYPHGSSDNFRQHYPSTDGNGCTCQDSLGAWCTASCAANIRNHQVVSTYGTGNITASCPAGSAVLGCGMGAMSASLEQFKTDRVTSTSATSCTCYHGYGATCYAACGRFF